MLNFIPATVGAILLVAGVVGLLTKGKISSTIGSVGRVVGLKAQMFFFILIAVGIIVGGFGVITGLVGGTFSTASISSTDAVAGSTVGSLTLKVHDGTTNNSLGVGGVTTEDYYNDDDTFLTFYSADASIIDGEEYAWNITIERAIASKAAVVTVTCSVPDKEISGVTADNLAEKTSGRIDLDINDAGNHLDDNTVARKFAIEEGSIGLEVQIAFDQEETYHDGMTDLDDYVDAVCVVSADDGASASVTTRIYADG